MTAKQRFLARKTTILARLRHQRQPMRQVVYPVDEEFPRLPDANRLPT